MTRKEHDIVRGLRINAELLRNRIIEGATHEELRTRAAMLLSALQDLEFRRAHIQ